MLNEKIKPSFGKEGFLFILKVWFILFLRLFGSVE